MANNHNIRPTSTRFTPTLKGAGLMLAITSYNVGLKI